MKNKIYALTLIILTIFLVIANQVEARGGGGRGGGGGGRGGGGGGRGGGGRAAAAGVSRGGNFARTPSMSRAVPQQKAVQARSQVRTQQTQWKGNNTATRAQVKQSLQQLPQQRLPQQAATRQAVTRQQGTQQVQPRQAQISKANISKIQQNARTTANRVSNQVRQNRGDQRNWFSNDFYSNHRINPAYPLAGAALWRTARWGDVSNWLGWGGVNPYYYNDSSGYYPYTDSSYVTGPSPQIVSTTIQPFQAEIVAPSDLDYQSNYSDGTMGTMQGNWLPLGVFAAGKNAEQAAYSNMVIQLAVSKSGEIAGTYYNSATDQAHPLDGVIVQQTQQAAWKMSDKSNSPLITTGIYNLTQDVVPIQVHFTDNSVQDWTLVRLNQ